MIRAQPDGEDEENDELDPRVEVHLRCLFFTECKADISLLLCSESVTKSSTCEN